MIIEKIDQTSRDLDLGDDFSELQKAKRALIPHVRSTRELPDGYAFLISNHTAPVLAMVEFFLLKESPCRYFKVEPDMTKESDAVWVHFTGGDCVKEFLRDELVRE